MRTAKGMAVSEYTNGSVGENGPDLFNSECHAKSYIGALVSCGYTVTIEKEDEIYKYPKD